MRIDRCVCFRRTFEDLLRVAEEQGIRKVEELQQRVTFGLRCGRCLPYVRQALETGQVVFSELLEVPSRLSED